MHNTELVGLDRLESFSYESFSVSCCACTDVLLFFSLQRMSLFIVPTGFILVLIFHLAIGDRQPTVKSSEKDKSGATLSQTLISVKQLDAQKDTGNMTNSQFSHIPEPGSIISPKEQLMTKRSVCFQRWKRPMTFQERCHFQPIIFVSTIRAFLELGKTGWNVHSFTR